MTDDLYQGKYKNLSDFLRASDQQTVGMTFAEIEKVLGFSLPVSARQHQAWWANQPRGQSLSWLREGYRTAAVSVDEERLTFLRAADGEQVDIETKKLPALTIAQAKEALALSLGVKPSQIEITVRG